MSPPNGASISAISSLLSATSAPAKFSSVRDLCLPGACPISNAAVDTCGEVYVRRASGWNDVRTERACPGDAQLGGGDFLLDGDGFQGLDDDKVVLEVLR